MAKEHVRLVAAGILLSACCTAAAAMETSYLNNAQGRRFLELHFYTTQDGSFNPGDPTAISTWNLSNAQKAQLLSGLDYWGEMIQLAPRQSPAVINVGTMQDINAYAISPQTNLSPSRTLLQGTLQNYPGFQGAGVKGIIGIGMLPWNAAVYVPSLLPTNHSGADFTTVVRHELAHALGISSSVTNTSTNPNAYNPVFNQYLSTWSTGFRDDTGKQARPGQVIWCNGCENPQAPDVFDVRNDTGYFTGRHVNEVLAGAMPGIPIRMKAGNIVDDNFMSHSELKNSQMSHQNYRNHTTFMEAELAIMQDMDYNIDRRNFFGFSVYGDSQTLVNNHGYFARNGNGTAYVVNTYNTASLGLGLHVYGSRNKITQQANLLTVGSGSAGIRVDGEGNTLTILPGTRVHANGAYGRGVMFTYGKGHHLVHRGDIEALGNNGIGLNFDFGNNALGNNIEYRGSFILKRNDQAVALLRELDGPLAEFVDITGRIAGRQAAIFISENAYVGYIQIMQGASLIGDIHSAYHQVDSAGKLRISTLNFGYASDMYAQATGVADARFTFRYNGNITGLNNLSLQTKGGNTEINGKHAVYEVDIAPGSRLSGNSQYQINSVGNFSNHGTLAVGGNGNTTITGNYVQHATGTLGVGFSSNHTLHNLVVTGSATIAGGLVITPERGWYANGAEFTSNKWIEATNLTGNFTTVTASLVSPTLLVTVTDLGNNTYRVTTSRRLNAYAQQAANDTDQGIGAALDTLAANPDADMKSLFTALDFSAENGSDIRDALSKLSPGNYAGMVHGNLRRQRGITQLLQDTAQENVPGRTASGWQTFATPFGGYYRYDRQPDGLATHSTTYGVVVGGNVRSGPYQHLQLGIHGAIAGQTTSTGLAAAASGSSTTLMAGGQAGFMMNPFQGPHLFATANMGIDIGSLERQVHINGYSNTMSGTWTGFAMTNAIEGGWRIQTGEATSIGPIAGIDYTLLYRPQVTESGGSGTVLHLDSQTFNAMRSRLGAQWQSTLQPVPGKVLKTSIKAVLQHELWDVTVHQEAAFKGARDSRFAARNTIGTRNNISIQADVGYRVKDALDIKFGMSTLLWNEGDTEFTGNVSVNMQF